MSNAYFLVNDDGVVRDKSGRVIMSCGWSLQTVDSGR